MFADSAFPQHNHPPAQPLQLGLVALILQDVAAEFFGPELSVGGGNGGVTAAGMTVPKTAVDENRGAVALEDKVRLAGKPSFGNLETAL